MIVNLRSNEGAELGPGGLSGISQLEALSDSGCRGVLERDGGESLDVEVGAGRARLDELSGEREDGAGSKGSVEGSRDSFGARCNTDEGLVTSLNGGDGRGSGKDVRGVDQGSGTEVCRDTDSLEDTSSSNHGLCVGESGIEVVLTWLHGLCASTCDGTDESGNVDGLGLSNVGERGDLRRAEAQSHEVACREFGKALLVEG